MYDLENRVHFKRPPNLEFSIQTKGNSLCTKFGYLYPNISTVNPKTISGAIETATPQIEIWDLNKGQSFVDECARNSFFCAQELLEFF